jgi:hypothetical protein
MELNKTRLKEVITAFVDYNGSDCSCCPAMEECPFDSRTMEPDCEKEILKYVTKQEERNEDRSK